MKVWVVFKQVWFDRYEFITLFDSEEKAKKFCEGDNSCSYEEREVE